MPFPKDVALDSDQETITCWCKWCSKAFEDFTRNDIFCSEDCRDDAFELGVISKVYEKHYESNFFPGERL